MIKLLEATHGQWLYRNVVVHDIVGGLEAVKRKQELQSEIERQVELLVQCNAADQAEAFGRACNSPPALDLRVNRLRSSREAVLQALAAAGVAAAYPKPIPIPPNTPKPTTNPI